MPNIKPEVASVLPTDPDQLRDLRLEIERRLAAQRIMQYPKLLVEIERLKVEIENAIPESDQLSDPIGGVLHSMREAARKMAQAALKLKRLKMIYGIEDHPGGHKALDQEERDLFQASCYDT